MKKRLLVLVLLLVSVLTVVGCEEKSKNSDAISFKNEYEKINGTTNKSGKEHRTINIDEDNVFVEISAEEIVKKIENKESFYVYFGSKTCPWCRSVIEKADKVSKENGIDKIYYVDIWDENGNEILRDKYVVNEKNELEVAIEGTDSYKKLLTHFDSLLKEYNVTNNDGESISTGEKRIYAPNFIYINRGTAVRLTTGISSKQKDSREELTEEMLKDEEDMFDKFFISVCDESC